MDIEDHHKFINSHKHLQMRSNFLDHLDKFPQINSYLDDLIKEVSKNLDISKTNFNNFKISLEKKYKYDRIKNVILIYHVKKYYSLNKIKMELYLTLIKNLQTKACRSLSGILEVAIMTSPDNMAGSNDGCDYDCYFCPKQKGFPRSYIKEEPAVRRAAQFKFDTIKQLYDRLSSYMSNGHDIDKLEIIVLGGTWSSYEYEYQKEFVTKVYYAANTFYTREGRGSERKMKSLEEEIEINMTALCKIIGFTIETRPDTINQTEILRLREFGVTRVQIGVQTTNNRILRKINRGCYNKDTIRAIKLLKNSGFKVLIHLMPNLPFSNPEIDKQSFDDVLYNSEYQIDELKIYPTSVTTTSDKDNTEVLTVIEKWYNDGKYVPYSQEELYEVIKYFKEIVPKHIRISRVFRDIPISNISGGARVPNMRQVLQKRMEDEGKYCKCIRCREIKDTHFNKEDIYYETLKYESSGGIEYFISANIKSKCLNPHKSTLVGFLRLRLPTRNLTNNEVLDFLPNLQDSSIVRELHVYGRMIPVHYYKNNYKEKTSQHLGIGKELMKIAERISRKNNYSKISVISGVGVRKYYEKQGYALDNTYMSKKLYFTLMNLNYLIFIVMFLLLIVINIKYFYKMIYNYI